MKKIRTQKGFTIVELAIATLVFSVLLTIVMVAFLNVGRLFVKGVNLSLTQQNARTVMDSITSDIRFSQGSPPTITTITTNGKTENYFCVGQHRYKFILANQVKDPSSEPKEPSDSGYPNYGLVRENISGCPDLGTAGSSPVEMLSNNMQLNQLQFGPNSDHTCNGKLCTVAINLLFYGADGNVFASTSHPSDTPSQALLESDAHCAGADLGSQFCASTSLTTAVLQSYP